MEINKQTKKNHLVFPIYFFGDKPTIDLSNKEWETDKQTQDAHELHRRPNKICRGNGCFFFQPLGATFGGLEFEIWKLIIGDLEISRYKFETYFRHIYETWYFETDVCLSSFEDSADWVLVGSWRLSTGDCSLTSWRWRQSQMARGSTRHFRLRYTNINSVLSDIMRSKISDQTIFLGGLACQDIGLGASACASDGSLPTSWSRWLMMMMMMMKKRRTTTLQEQHVATSNQVANRKPLVLRIARPAQADPADPADPANPVRCSKVTETCHFIDLRTWHGWIFQSPKRS